MPWPIVVKDPAPRSLAACHIVCFVLVLQSAPWKVVGTEGEIAFCIDGKCITWFQDGEFHLWGYGLALPYVLCLAPRVIWGWAPSWVEMVKWQKGPSCHGPWAPIVLYSYPMVESDSKPASYLAFRVLFNTSCLSCSWFCLKIDHTYHLYSVVLSLVARC